jgi:small-conductance mechanosensitive channel
MKEFLPNLQSLAWSVGVMGGSLVIGLAVHYLFFKIMAALVKRAQTAFGESSLKHCRGPSRLIIPLLIIHFSLPISTIPVPLLSFIKQTLALVLIMSVAWLAIKIFYVIEDLILRQFRIDVADNLRARRIHTQIKILKKMFVVVVAILALAIILMTFEKVRYLGTSILASAGIAGIIIGLAAQRSIATLLAGLQMAITQPIRLDDVVIVEGEWGRIEEITLTYVVMRIWDLRRLIVPMTYFLEKPFQNWTRVSAELLGTVFLYVDYTVPVQAVREELRKIVENSKLWDGKVCVLQVTNATERTMELRALMSARDSSSAWELRCEVREKLIHFLQENYSDGLPRIRGELRPSYKGATEPTKYVENESGS